VTICFGQFRLLAFAVAIVVLFGDVQSTFASCGDWLQRHPQSTSDKNPLPENDGSNQSSPGGCSGPYCHNGSLPPLEGVPSNMTPPRIDELGVMKPFKFVPETDSSNPELLVSVIPSAGHFRRVERPPRVTSQQSV